MITALVVVRSLTQPAWVAHVVETIRDSGFAEIGAVLVHGEEAPRRKQGLLHSLYSHLDDASFRRDDDALAMRDLRRIVDARIVADSSALARGDGGFDVVLAFEAVVPRELAESSRHGVWTCHFDQWDAFASRSATTTCTVEAERRGHRAVVGATRAATDLISMRRGTSRLAWRTATLLLRSLQRLSATGLTPAAATTAQKRSPVVVRAALAAAARYALQRFRDRWTEEQWHVAFRFGDTLDVTDLRSLHTIAPPPDRLWADPFVIHQEGRAFIFVEELVYSEGRGVIAVTEAYADGSFSKPQRILEQPYHLSYPCVFRWKDEWYMVPETMENATIEMYRCVDFPLQWAPAAVLFHDVKAVDSTLFELHGQWWMYTTTSADGKTFDELSIYHAESPFGPWIAHPRNPVLSDAVGGRCGGRPFRRNGRLLRAAQISAPRYGYAIQIREIVTLTPDEWEEREVTTILPGPARRMAGIHTLNVDGSVTVMDGLRYRRRR